MSTPPRLDVTGLEKSFGNEFAVSAVDLTVEDEEIVALLGPSGCGKTTTLRCIAGVETPDAGEIRIGGDVVYGPGVSKPPEKRDIGMIYQSYAIWPHKSVYENVVFPLKHATHTIPSSEYEPRVDHMLELMEIKDLKHAPATDLSGGQQQRTALARSLVHDPDLLLMDEPLSNLDRELRTNMRYELQRLHNDLGISVLYVTHDQEEAFYLADRIAVMKDGEIVEQGTPRELYNRPRSRFTRRFLGQRNRLAGTVETDTAGEPIVRTPVAVFPLSNADFVGNGVEAGTEVTCFIRPEDIELGRFSTGKEDVLELTGTTVAEGLLGDTYELTVQLENRETELVVHTEQYQQFGHGERIDLHIGPGDVQVYPGSDNES